MSINRKIGKKPAIAILVVVVLIAGGAVFFFTHKTKDIIQVTPASSSGSNGKSSSKKSSAAKSGGSTVSAKGNSTTQNPPPSGLVLEKPFGTFVSNHRPSLSGSAAEASVCNTTPGATCYIEFTKDSTVKQLPAETADSGGSVYWNWNVKQAGLTPGTWTIQAVATLDGKTMNAQDSLGLDVQP